MQPNPDSEAWLETDSAVVTADQDAAPLMVRLGLAINALRAQQRWSVSLLSGSGVVNANDFAQSLVIALSYPCEALNILTGTNRHPGNSREVRALAQRQDVPPALLAKMGQLMGAGHAASPLFARARNRLGFHWDPELLRPELAGVANDPVIWLEGRATVEGAMVYTFAADVLLNALLPGVGSQSPEDASERIRQASAAITDAMDCITTYFGSAMAGYLSVRGVRQRER